MKNKRPNLQIDVFTVIAISIVAWALAIIMHEVVGHAGVAALLGIPVRAVSSTNVDIASYQVKTIGESRLIHIGGTFINLLSGSISLLLLRFRKKFANSVRFFLWLFTTMSFIIVLMNLISATAFGVGDWMEVIKDLNPRNVYKALIVGMGILLALPGYWLPLRVWLPDLKGNRLTLLKVTAIPVLTVIIIQMFSALQNPSAHSSNSPVIFASLFLSIHLILWAVLVNVIPVPRSKENIESIRINRSLVWLVTGIIVLLFFVFILGPGLGPMG